MYRKSIQRLICLALAIVILGALIPLGANAAEPESEQIKSKLSRMYRQVLDIAQKETLNGYCATLVTWELYIMGINRQFVGGDGKDQFDNYCNEEVTTGGYYIHGFPATEYTLEEALLAMTNNGERNAYNILIGFEKTNTSSGAYYGHTVFIGGIVDGNVYYVESDDYTVGGVYYPTGTPICCTISQFAGEYDGWATFEGAIEFTEERYLDQCEEFPTDLYVQTTQATALRTEPCGAAQSHWSEEIRRVREKEIFHVDGLFQNTEGEYWYRVADLKDYYLPAENTVMLQTCFDRVTVVDVQAPGILDVGEAYDLTGSVVSSGSEIHMIRCQIFSDVSGAGVLVDNAMDVVQSQQYEIGGSTAAAQLAFKDLEPGLYHYVISATVYDYYLEDNKVERQWSMVKLWTSDFLVAETETDDVVISIDANGGSAVVDQTVLSRGTRLRTLAVPERVGYSFDGWYQQSQDGQMSPVNMAWSDLAVYAMWSEATQNLDGWHQMEGAWRFYQDGQAVTGWLEWDGIPYYLDEDGAVHTGWLQLDGERFYFFENGTAAAGSILIDGIEYMFNQRGQVQENWMSMKNQFA